jgi:hypothetical protein
MVELLGEIDFGGGASGGEIDKLHKFVLGNGTLPSTVILATNIGNPEEFRISINDARLPILNTLGKHTEENRADIVYYESLLSFRLGISIVTALLPIVA